MINIKCFQCNPLQENCYVVSTPEGEAAIIDCGAFFDSERKAIVRHIRENRLVLQHVLCTHAHFDHIFGLNTLYDEFGLCPRLHPADNDLYNQMDHQVALFMGNTTGYAMPALGAPLADGEQLALGSRLITTLHTPGHSPGSVLFYLKDEKTIFAGDTLFRMSVGRTDLEGGSWEQLMDSLHHTVSRLPSDVTVYTGHGPATTIGDELLMNPYLK